MLYPGNEVEIFTNGKDKFESLLNDLRGAKEYIHLQYYIFEDDKIGCEVREILTERASAGVKVRVIYDHVGSISVKKRFFAKWPMPVYRFIRFSEWHSRLSVHA